MKNLSSLILFLTFILFACKKEVKPYVPVQRCADRTRNMDTINLYIHGTWKFVEELRVSREYGVQYLTPDSPEVGHWTLKLYGDTATFFTNNIEEYSYRFRIQRELDFTNYPTDSLPVLAYYSFSSGGMIAYIPIEICSNQLLMQGQYVSSVVGERLWIRK